MYITACQDQPVTAHSFLSSNRLIFQFSGLHRRIYLSVRCWNESHEFIYVADKEPVRKQGNGLLNLLSPQEVLNHFGHVPSFSCPSGKRRKHVHEPSTTRPVYCAALRQWTGCIHHVLKSHLWMCTNSRREGHSDEDSAQRVVLPIHSDGRTNLQVAERVQTAHVFSLGHPRHVAKVRALRAWRWSKIPSRHVSGHMKVL